MGVVYRGHHVVLNKRVAIKVLRSEYSRDSELMERFINEAKAASAIGNAHIIDVTDVGRLQDRSTYMVMEYLEGRDLFDVIDGQPLPAEQILHISRQMALGMEAAHKVGIVHRDLKPDNIFLVNRGSETDFVKILDFGIAKFSTESKLTRPGEIFGTPHYMSPEQAAGQTVDQRSDIYSMGVILYEMAGGKVPFDGDTPMAILNQHLTKTAQPLRINEETRSRIPEDLEKIIFKCLEKHPQNRYQNMGELYSDLNALKQGIAPSEPPKPQKQPPWGVIGGVSGLLAMGGLGWYLLRKDETPVETPAGPSTQPTEVPEATIPPQPTVAIEDLPRASHPMQKVIISVEPLHAKIFVDGEFFGNSPVSIEIPEGENVEVQIKKKGYVSKKLTLDSSKEKISVKLQRISRPPLPVNPPQPPAPRPTTPKPPPPKKDDGVVNPW
ncbi:MAG: serine/threonine-protein kinase [bacterium]|nr:serine/threonine-protein kinase [bacterium]